MATTSDRGYGTAHQRVAGTGRPDVVPDSDMRDLIRRAQRAGGRVKRGGGHVKVSYMGKTTAVPTTPSDRRSAANTVAQLRRIGLEL